MSKEVQDKHKGEKTCECTAPTSAALFGLLLIVASGVMNDRMTLPAIIRAVLPFLAAKLLVLGGLCVLAATLAR